MDATIRPGTGEDVEAICRVGRRTWREAYASVLEESTIDAALAEWYAPAAVRSFVTDDEVAYFVAERDGEPTDDLLGYVGGGPVDGDPGLAELGAIYVDPDHWGEGIGTALLARFERDCRDRGCERLRIVVLADNELGRSFYERAGYDVVEERTVDLFGESVAECVYAGPID